jgi:GT2 family glycosyltransferase/glycosyltransferase involved in cell wall biosynthesis/predicted SAM-dependent methyltransferase
MPKYSNQALAPELATSFEGVGSFLLGDVFAELNPKETEFIELKSSMSNLFYSEYFLGKKILITSADLSYFAFWSLFKGAEQVHLIASGTRAKQVSKIKEILGINSLSISSSGEYLDAHYDIIISEDEVFPKNTKSDIFICKSEKKPKSFEYKKKINNIYHYFKNKELFDEIENSYTSPPISDLFVNLSELGGKYVIARNSEIITLLEDSFDDITIDLILEDNSRKIFENICQEVRGSFWEKNTYFYPIGENVGKENGKENDKNLFIKVSIISSDEHFIPKQLTDEFLEKREKHAGLWRLDALSYFKYLVFNSVYIQNVLDKYWMENINKIANEVSSHHTLISITLFSEIVKIAKENNVWFGDKYSENKEFLYPTDQIISNKLIALGEQNIIFRTYDDGDKIVHQSNKEISVREFNLLNKIIPEQKIAANLKISDKYASFEINKKHSAFIKNEEELLSRLAENEGENPQDYSDLFEIENKSSASVIVLGLPGSGTELITEILDIIGYSTGYSKYMGVSSLDKEKFIDNDFAELNSELLESLGKSWEYPPESSEITKSYDKQKDKLSHLIKFKQHKNKWAFYHKANSLFLEMYLENIENIKVIRINSNEIELAQLLEKNHAFGSQMCHELISTYREFEDLALEKFKEIEIIEIDKEELIKSTDETLEELADFLDCDIDSFTIMSIKSMLRRSIPKSPDLGEFSPRIKELIENNQHESALELIEGILTGGIPASAERLLYFKALCQFEIGWFEEAFATISDEIIINPENDLSYELAEKIEDAINENLGTKEDKTSTLLSIIVIVRNQIEITKDCIEHIIRNTRNDFELIIYDNGSEAECSDYVQSITGIKLIRSEGNTPLASARNEASQMASGKYIVFLDNDCLPENNWDEVFISEFERNPKCSAQSGMLKYPNGLVQSAGIVIGKNPEGELFPYSIYKYASSKATHVRVKRKYKMLAGSCLCLRKNQFDRVGGFDEAFIFGYEDFDLCMKLAENSGEIVYNPDSVIVHIEAMTKEEEQENIQIYEENNHKLFLKKWAGKTEQDDERYYDQDKLWGLSLDAEKYSQFQDALKNLLEGMNKFHGEKYQSLAQSVSEKMFGRTGVDFVGDTQQVFSLSLNQIEDAIKFVEFETEDSQRFSDKGFVELSDVSSHTPETLNIALSCHGNKHEQYLNVDISDQIRNADDKEVFSLDLQDSCVDKILIDGVLELFPNNKTILVLGEINRVVKVGGEIILRLPNLKKQMETYLLGDWDGEFASNMIFGNSRKNKFHIRSAFDEESIKKYLIESGFLLRQYAENNAGQDILLENQNMTVLAYKSSENTSEHHQLSDIMKQFEENKDFLENEEEQTDSPTRARVFDPKIDGEKQLNIVWEGEQFGTDYFSDVNRNFCSEMINSQTHELSVLTNSDWQNDENGIDNKIKEYDLRVKSEVPEEILDLPYVWIRHNRDIKDEIPLGARWIIYLSGISSSLPKQDMNALENCDEIWTTSVWARNIIVNSGIDSDKVQVMPLGIDPRIFTPSGNKLKLKTSKKFKFLYSGEINSEMGVDLALESFVSTFKKDDDVCFVILAENNKKYNNSTKLIEKINEMSSQNDLAEIIFLEKDFDENQQSELFRSCDVFFMPFRDGGSGLNIMKAMACGLPIIVTDGGVASDFVKNGDGWLIPIKKEILDGETEYFIPDTQYLAPVLLDAFGNPSRLYSMGITSSARIRTSKTWRNSTIKILTRLDSLYGTSMGSGFELNLVEFEDECIFIGQAEIAFANSDFDFAIELYNSALSGNKLDKRTEIYCLNAISMTYFEKGDLNHASEFIEKANVIEKNNCDSLYLSAILARKQGNETKSLELFTSLINSWVDVNKNSRLGLTLDYLLCESGDILLVSGDLEGALQMYEIAMKNNPSSAVAYFGAGRCFSAAGEDEKAREMFDMAHQIDPSIEEIHEHKNI